MSLFLIWHAETCIFITDLNVTYYSYYYVTYSLHNIYTRHFLSVQEESKVKSSNHKSSYLKYFNIHIFLVCCKNVEILIGGWVLYVGAIHRLGSGVIRQGEPTAGRY